MGSAIDEAAVGKEQPVTADTGTHTQMPPRTPYDPKLAQAMLDRVVTAGPIGTRSGAETLKALRHAFPDSPLAARVAALNRMTRRSRGDPS